MSAVAAIRPDREPGLAALWLGAVALAAAAHAGAVVWALRQPPETAAPAAAPPAVMIDLAPAPAAPEAVEELIAPDVADAPEAEGNPLERVVDQLSEPEPVTPPPAPVEPPPPDAPRDLAPPVVAPPPALEPPPEVRAEVVLPRPMARPENLQAAALPEPDPKPKEPKPKEPRPAAQSTRAERAQVKAPPAEVAAAAPSASSGGGAVSPAKWQSRLMAHLERLKRYPSGARSRREEGVAHVRFSIDERGNVQTVRLVRSSGHPDLDEAVVALLRRASPVPPPPPGAPRDITAPVVFDIK